MNILIADDDATSRLLLAATLKKLGHEVTTAADGDVAWQAWQDQGFALVISDWLMPGLDGLQLCRAIRAAARPGYTHVVLLTALSGKDNYLDGMDAGADDFLSKPFDEAMLAARLRVAERMLALHDALRVQASHDRLTGALNRGAVLDYLHQELERATRERGCVGVALIDLDHFKSINDRYGHQAGDTVLIEAARRMQLCLRGYDRMGRYGGEEFLVVAPGSGPEQACAVAERIRVQLAAAPIATDAGALTVTLSAGAASGAGPESAVTLIAAADAALYRAKAAGRNRVEPARMSSAEDR